VETNLVNAGATPQAIWPIAKSLMNRNGSRALHGTLGLEFHSIEKANVIADCLEKQFTPDDVCDENHERWVEVSVQALLEAVDK
jgi:hypothetical protein